ncbi:hypothetical protein MYOV011v1_p0329 [Vibrio phage 6E35.1a]|nr:hypothetical protein MYOV011v1_p0329 [Vibrio phage 6E35.1a]
MIEKLEHMLTVGDITYGSSWDEFIKLNDDDKMIVLNGTLKDGKKLPTFEHEELDHVLATIKQSLSDRVSAINPLNRFIVIHSDHKKFKVRFGYGGISKSPANFIHEITIGVKNK